MRKHHKFPRRLAFTLIELLVVIAIIGILAGLLLPVLVRGQVKAQQTKCLSNLKQVALGFIVWVTDHEANGLPYRIPVANGGNIPDSSVPQPPGIAFRNNLWWQYAFVSNELDSPKILSCPADRRAATADNWGPVASGGFLNAAFQNNACSYALGLDAGVSYLNGGKGNQYLDFGGAADHILLMDRNVKVDPSAVHCTSGISPANQLSLVNGLGNSGWLAGVHGPNAGNVAKLDGSVQSVTSRGLNELVQVGDANGSPHLLLP